MINIRNRKILGKIHKENPSLLWVNAPNDKGAREFIQRLGYGEVVYGVVGRCVAYLVRRK